MNFHIPRINVISCGISHFFHASVSLLFPAVAIHFSSITELKLFPEEATDQRSNKEVICIFIYNMNFFCQHAFLFCATLNIFSQHESLFGSHTIFCWHNWRFFCDSHKFGGQRNLYVNFFFFF